jgi:hypothetical protein
VVLELNGSRWVSELAAPPEKNDRWATGVRLFLASTLSLILPAYPVLDDDRALWLEIVRHTFQSGVYCEDDEIKAHAELTGATVRGSYLVLRGKYQVINKPAGRVCREPSGL